MEDDIKTEIEAKRKRKRERAVNELIQTEQKYVERLERLNKIYIKPLDNYNNMVLPYDDHIKLFPKILQNIIKLNKKILKDLTPNKSLIGKTMVQLVPRLKIYQTYLNDYDSINDLMLKLRKNKNSYFIKYLHKQEKNDQGYTIESYLIEPIQRIGRYELLFSQILQFTVKTHKDYNDLKQCLEKLSQQNRVMNKKIAEYEQRHKVFLIETRIVNIDIKNKYASSTNYISSWLNVPFGGSGGGGDNKDNKLQRTRLVTPSRKFIKQGQMTKVGRKGDVRYIFILFNDLLLYCSEGMNNMLIMHERINLNDAYFHVIECSKDIDYSAYNAFEIHSIEKSFIAYGGTRKETVQWYNAIQDCLDKIRDSGNLQILEIDPTSPINSELSQSDISGDIRIIPTAPLWKPGKDNINCMVSDCGKAFRTWIRPSHYCNYCGNTVCYECFKHKLLHYNPEKRRRGIKVSVCDECFRKYKKKIRNASTSESSLSDIKFDSEDFDTSDDSDEDGTEAFLCYQKLISMGIVDDIAMEACKQYSDINHALTYIRNNYKDEEKKMSMVDFDELISSKYRTVEFDVFVAIDFGTHGTGLGYAVKKTKVDDWGDTQDEYTTFKEQDWVGDGGTAMGEIKNKTDILLTCEGKFIAFGYAALNKYKREEDEESDSDDEELKEDDSKKMAERDMLFESFKMSLYKTDGKDKGDIKEMIPCKDGRLFSTEIVFVEALKFIKRSVFKTFKKNGLNIQNKDSDLERIQWILTVPAIWSDRAKYKMELWTQCAGLTKKDIKDHIRIVYEPDCASISCQYEHNSEAQLTEKKPFEKGEKYILIDAGGGTVDIACHMVIDQDQMQEVYHPTGGPWGSDYVDVYFEKFLGELFGNDEIDQYIYKYPHDWTKILHEFRSAKMTFYKDKTAKYHPTQLTFEFTLNFEMDTISNMQPFGLYKRSVYADDDRIFISTEIWQKYLFDQVMNPMIQHIEHLLNNKVKDIQYICICGGMSMSQYFKAKMDESFGKKSKYKLAIRTPRAPILSVIDGAVKLATRPNYISGRKLRKSYGIAVDKPLQDIDQSRLPSNYLNTHVTNKTVSGLFSKFVSKNTLVKAGEYIEKTYSRGSLTETKKIIKIYSSDLRDPYVVLGEPLAELAIHFKRNYNDLKFKIKLNFGTTKIRVFAMNEEIEVNYKFYNASRYVEMKDAPKPEIDDIRLNQRDCKMEIMASFPGYDYRYDDIDVKAWFEVEINDENYKVGTRYEILPIIIQNLSVGIDYQIRVKCINDKSESISDEFKKKEVLFKRKPPMPKILKRQALDNKIFLKYGCDYNFNEEYEECRPKYEIKILGKKYNKPNIITSEKQITIEWLPNGIDYRLKIRAINKYGDSKWTKWSLLTPLKKPYKPCNLLSVSGNEAITLYWISLDNIGSTHLNGQFKIISHPETTDLFSIPNIETKKTKLKIEFKRQHRLRDDIDYKFKVFALNNNFQTESEWSEPIRLNVDKTKREYTREKNEIMKKIYDQHRKKSEQIRRENDEKEKEKEKENKRERNLQKMKTKIKIQHTKTRSLIQEIKEEKDIKIELSLDCEFGKLLKSLPMEGVIEYEKENTFWMIKLGKEWQDNKKQFALLSEKLYCNEIWYKEAIERGTKWANKINEKQINIKTVPPTAISGLHITLKRIDINDKDKPKCFVDGNIVKFKIKRLVCFPPFRENPKNLPGQEIDNGYRWYATCWFSLEIEFEDFEYKTRFPSHVSLCNVGVKLKVDDVEKWDDSK